MLLVAPRPALRPSLSSVYLFLDLDRTFRSQYAPFSCRFAPSRLTPLFRTAFLRSYFSLVYRALFSSLFPTWNLAYIRYIATCVPPPYSRTEFVPVSTHFAPSILTILFSLFFLLGLFLNHAELPACLSSSSSGKTCSPCQTIWTRGLPTRTPPVSLASCSISPFLRACIITE